MACKKSVKIDRVVEGWSGRNKKEHVGSKLEYTGRILVKFVIFESKNLKLVSL